MAVPLQQLLRQRSSAETCSQLVLTARLAFRCHDWRFTPNWRLMAGASVAGATVVAPVAGASAMAAASALQTKKQVQQAQRCSTGWVQQGWFSRVVSTVSCRRASKLPVAASQAIGGHQLRQDEHLLEPRS
jgi:uncharacterized membrane protein